MIRAPILFITFSTLTLTQSGAQDYELPKMNHYDIKEYVWASTSSHEQRKHWDNGNPKIEYIDLENGHKLRKEYFSEGRLKMTVEVMQIHEKRLDSIFDPDDPSVIVAVDTIVGFIDIPDGRYVEYHEPYYSSSDIPRTTGQFLNGAPHGRWETEKGVLGYIVEANYNEEGYLEGPYKEYYPSYPNKKQNLKISGNYSQVLVTRKDRYSPGNRYVTYKTSHRVGTWKLHDEEGAVIEEVTYKWKATGPK